MHPTVVADAGGLLTLSGTVEGIAHQANEICAVDTSSLLLAEFLLWLHEGRPEHASVEFGIVSSRVQEWFPARPVAIEAAMRRDDPDIPMDSVVALVLAESLRVPLVTKHRELVSRKIPVLYA